MPIGEIAEISELVEYAPPAPTFTDLHFRGKQVRLTAINNPVHDGFSLIEGIVETAPDEVDDVVAVVYGNPYYLNITHAKLKDKRKRGSCEKHDSKYPNLPPYRLYKFYYKEAIPVI